jgi:hypothetical protein
MEESVAFCETARTSDKTEEKLRVNFKNISLKVEVCEAGNIVCAIKKGFTSCNRKPLCRMELNTLSFTKTRYRGKKRNWPQQATLPTSLEGITSQQIRKQPVILHRLYYSRRVSTKT